MLQYDTDTEYDTVFKKDCFFYFYYSRFKVPDSSQCPFLKYGVMFTSVCLLIGWFLLLFTVSGQLLTRCCKGIQYAAKGLP